MIADEKTSEAMATFAREFAATVLAEVRKLISNEQLKTWYSVDELAHALEMKPFTVREKWCNSGRIEAKKDVDSNRWLIPGTEYKRLVLDGGRPLPLKDVSKSK